MMVADWLIGTGARAGSLGMVGRKPTSLEKHKDWRRRGPDVRLAPRALLALLALAAALLAGCSGGAETKYALSGAFKASRADHDLQDLAATAEPYGGDTAIMESFPEQFSIRGIDAR